MGRKRIPTSVRFALDPAQWDYWAGVIIGCRIPEVAKLSGLDSEWVEHSIKAVKRHARAGKKLARLIGLEIG